MKTQNVLVAGVGGEGVLSAGVVVARAAGIAGLGVKGMQLHGLAQRGGSVPTHVRFGKNIGSPTIPMGEADLVIAIEPSEAIKACYFASKKRTGFVIDTRAIPSIYVRLNNRKYPAMKEIARAIRPFARKVVFVDASETCEKRFGSPLFANTMVLGVAFAEGLIRLGKKEIAEAIRETFPHDAEKNLEAFELGMRHGKIKK